MTILDVGAGPNSKADIQIDIHEFHPGMIKQDAMMETWKVKSESVDEVRMEQFLEHCPVIVKKWCPEFEEWVTHYPRIHCMREAWRVLKHGGILHVSVPGTSETHSQDPTHDGPQITEGFFHYFCGEWGATEPGSFVNDSYGINFKFKILSVEPGWILTVRMVKE